MDVSQRGEMTRDLTSGVTRSSGSFELLAGAAVFAMLGYFVDRVTGTFPMVAIIGGLFGFCIAAGSLVVQYKVRMVEAGQARAEASRQ